MDPNVSYYVGFATVFYAIALISVIQLILCIRSEFCRMKKPVFLAACRVTTQKAIYMVICLASIIRGIYFSYQGKETPDWAQNLLSAYYPILLTGSSLVVCFWAEVFHLQDLRLDQQQFLGKSFIGFIGFNVIAYSLLLAEFLLTSFTSADDLNRLKMTNIFYCCYAILFFIVVVFFLFYGVEVYFKVRGGFARGTLRSTNSAQLHQSRFGLVFQACMLLITIGFLFSEIFRQLWQDKVDVFGRNFHDVLFRLVEIGVALWFPCVLWNCMKPEQLWILNPRQILKRRELEQPVPEVEGEALVEQRRSSISAPIPPQPICAPLHSLQQLQDSSSQERLSDCWICYDSERTDAGALIQPCLCKGDVGSVHHECLRKWLVECASSPDNLKCKVCQQPYVLEKGLTWLPAGFTAKSWLYTVAIVTCMCGSAVGAWSVIQLVEEPGIRMLTVGVAVIVFYVCLKFLGFNAVTAYQRARVSAVKVLGRRQSQPSSSSAAGHSNGPEFVKINVITSGLPSLDETRL